jgi:hypothetical protein
MSIALSLARENSIELNFERILYPVGARESQKGQRLYAAMSKLGKTFVTTNYDEWLDKAIDTPAPSIVSVSDLSRTAQPSRTVIYKVDDLIFDNLARS